MKLSGIRVIDLTLFLPGPYLTLAMADHGAEAGRRHLASPIRFAEEPARPNLREPQLGEG